jgi:hypothetical protein
MLTIDYILLAILIVSLAVGLYRGFFKQALSLVPWLVVLWAALRFGHLLEPMLAFVSSDALRAWSARIIAFILILVAGVLIKSLAGKLIAKIGLTGVPGRIEDAPPSEETGPTEVLERAAAATVDEAAAARAEDLDFADLDYERTQEQPVLDPGIAGLEDETAGFLDITDIDSGGGTGQMPEHQAGAGGLHDETQELEAGALAGEDVDLDFSELTMEMDLDFSEMTSDLDLDIAEADQSATGPSPGSGTWAVQVGSFSKADSVERLVAVLGTQGFDVFVTLIDGSDGPMYGVRVGPVDKREDAEALAVRLQAAGQQGRVVRSEG